MAFTTIGVGASANDGTGDPARTAFQAVNTNFGKAVEGPASATDAAVAVFDGVTGKLVKAGQSLAQQLAGWTEAGAYEATSVTFDADQVVTTATVKWPDGSAGVFTRTAKDDEFLAVDAYTLTHTDSGKTVVQAGVTRDADGAVTVKPALTVS